MVKYLGREAETMEASEKREVAENTDQEAARDEGSGGVRRGDLLLTYCVLEFGRHLNAAVQPARANHRAEVAKQVDLAIEWAERGCKMAALLERLTSFALSPTYEGTAKAIGRDPGAP